MTGRRATRRAREEVTRLRWNDSLIFASVLLFVFLTWLDFVMCAFDDINIHIFGVVSGLIPYIML